MPIFTLTTNVAKDKVPKDFLGSTSALVANLLSKPESYVCVHLKAEDCMTFAGTGEPCAFGSLRSIGGINASKNKTHADKLYAHIHEKLGIAKNRMYIEFVDLPPANVGYNGSTFA